MSLMGDAIDNIPGVKGIGEKTAVELIAEFGSLDGVYKNIDKVKGEARKRILAENKDMAYLSRELAVLDENVPLKIDFKELEIKEADQGKLFELFREFEFKSLLKDVTPKGTLKSVYELIEDEKDFAKLVEELKSML